MKEQQTSNQAQPSFTREQLTYAVIAVNPAQRRVMLKSVAKQTALSERLDDVFGQQNWTDHYEVIPNGVICRLTINQTIVKEGVAGLVQANGWPITFRLALQAAVLKLGIGKELPEKPSVTVDLLERRPAGDCVHFLQSDNLQGWWQEPKVSDDDQSATNDPDFFELTLKQKVNFLCKYGVITTKKQTKYLHKIKDPTTGKGLLRYFEQQLELLYRLYNLSEDLPQAKYATIYKRIMASKLKVLGEIKTDLKQLEVA